MDLDDDAISTNRDRRPGDHSDQTLLSGSMGRIGDNRQMRKLLGERNGRQVHCVAGARLEGLDASLAKRDLIVTSGETGTRPPAATPSRLPMDRA